MDVGKLEKGLQLETAESGKTVGCLIPTVKQIESIHVISSDTEFVFPGSVKSACKQDRRPRQKSCIQSSLSYKKFR